MGFRKRHPAFPLMAMLLLVIGAGCRCRLENQMGRAFAEMGIQGDDWSNWFYVINNGDVTVSLSGAVLTNLNPLVSLPVQSLYLEDCTVSDLESIGKMTNLTALALRGCKGVKSLSFLENARQIDLLDLRGTEVMNIDSISRMPELENLSFDAGRIADLSPLADSKVTNLFVENPSGGERVALLQMGFSGVDDKGTFLRPPRERGAAPGARLANRRMNFLTND